MESAECVKNTKKISEKVKIEQNESSYRIEHVKRSTKEFINNNDSEKVLVELVKDIGNGDKLSVKARLQEIKGHGKCDWLKTYQNPDQQGETLLHLAIKSQDDIYYVKELSNMCPDLLLMAREHSLKFRGQTALHMAITKCNKEAIEKMLEACSQHKKEEMSTLLQTRATGFRFVNTVMMGQIPLTVAALTGNTEIVDALLKAGADLHIQNDKEDTVFHSLVKYAATYPEKVMTIIQMMRHLNDQLGKKTKLDKATFAKFGTEKYQHTYSFLWFVKNKENLTPLQLAAKHGVTEIFEVILNLKNVYCYISSNDGLFDVKEYDITEIDTVSVIKSSQSLTTPKSIPQYFDGISKNIVQSNEANCAICCSYPETESILEMLFQRDYESKDAYRIIELPPVQYIIRMKWVTYNWFFIWWMILHYVFMILLTMYSVLNVELGIPSMHGNNATTFSENFVHGFRWVSLVAGTLYAFIVGCLVIAKFRKKYISAYFLHNMEYIFPMLIFSVTIIFEVLWSFTEVHDNIPLIIALICGWWLNVFFLSPYKKFSFFTELIKQVIIGDLFRFGLVILFELLSFTAGMYIVFRGTDEEDFSSYGSTMMVMFKLGIGIDDISVLYSARIPWAAVTIFILFTTLTYILMLNALIAMMSQTCSSVSEERFPQWRIQQLSIILVIEDLICLCCFQKILSSAGRKKIVRGLDPKTRQIKYEDRYFLEIHALQMEYATAEDKIRIQKKSNTDGADNSNTKNKMPSSDKNTQTSNDTEEPHNLTDGVDTSNTKNKMPSSDKNTQTSNDTEEPHNLTDGSDNSNTENKMPSSDKNTQTLNYTEVPRNLTDRADNSNTKKKMPSSEENTRTMATTEKSSADDISLKNDVIKNTARLKKRTRKISPIFTQEPYIRGKNRKSTSKRDGIDEVEKVTIDNDFPHIDPSSRRITFARAPPIGFNVQKEQGQIEYEIRTLTDH